MSLLPERLADGGGGTAPAALLAGFLQLLDWSGTGNRESECCSHHSGKAHKLGRSSGASKLKRALSSLDGDSWRGKVLNVVSIVELGGVAATVGQLLSPKVRGFALAAAAGAVARRQHGPWHSAQRHGRPDQCPTPGCPLQGISVGQLQPAAEP